MSALIAFELPAALLGLLFGSFLNVCISRLPKHQSVVSPRSRCPHCGHAIRWFDNIPLVSWLVLRGRCRDCRGAIPLRYPLVELATGLWFAMAIADIAAMVGSSTAYTGEQWAFAVISAISVAAVGFLLVGLMVTDWQTGLLPDAFTLSGIFVALFLVCSQAIFLGPTEDQMILSNHHIQLTSPGSAMDRGNVFLTGPENLIFGRLAAVCAIALLLWMIRLTYKLIRGRDGMGLGDIKMMAMVTAFLGFWPSILTLFLGVIAAAVYSVVLLARGRANASTRVPFGSFLAVGGLLTVLLGSRIIDSYARLLR